MKRFRALMIVAACALTGVALPVLAGGFGDGFGGGAGAGLAYLATQFLPLTGGTMRNTIIFDNAAVALSTVSGNLVIDPAGSGATTITGDASITGNVTANLVLSKTTATEVITNASGAGNAGYAGLQTQSAGTITGRVMWCGNSSCTDADLQTRVTLVGYGGFMPAAASNTDVPANAVAFDVSDNVTATAARLFSVYGGGAVRMLPHTSAAGITCNSSSEGVEYIRVIAASNKSGKCLCTQTSSGVYAWTVSYTGGGTALVAGDC